MLGYLVFVDVCALLVHRRFIYYIFTLGSALKCLSDNSGPPLTNYRRASIPLLSEFKVVIHSNLLSLYLIERQATVSRNQIVHVDTGNTVGCYTASIHQIDVIFLEALRLLESATEGAQAARLPCLYFELVTLR